MTRQFRQPGCRWVRPVLCLALGMFPLSASSLKAQPAKRLLHNEDETNFFWHSRMAAGKAGEAIDQYVDVMAGAGITVFLCNTNARRTNYRSRVWESYWDGYDFAGPDGQPFLVPMARTDIPGFRKGVDNMLAVHKQGIDFPGRVVERCRHHGISPWITLRMNDCHYNDIPDHPFHGSFWKNNPQLQRKNCSGYFATCLDYAAQEVRDYFKALVAESLERYDIDGLELDFMREPYLFSAGKEAEGASILTGWMREVRKLTKDAAARRGHPVHLGVRVPSRPEVASAMGLDALTWAKEGLIDQLVVTPRWATLEFDMPIQQWRKMLGASKVTLAGGLEVRYQPCPGGPASVVTPELARGAAVLVLSQGADAVYLFNFFQTDLWPRHVYQNTLRSMSSLDSLLKLPRCVGITYRDIAAPGETYQAPLPATGKEVAFSMKLGPIPDSGWHCELLVGLAPPQGAAVPAPAASVNGKPCEVRSETTKDGLRLLSFNVPATALAGAASHQVKLASKDQSALTIHRVEMSLREPNGAGGKALY
jgi:hypothetical protein